MKKLIFRKITFDLLIFFSFSVILLGLIVWTLQAINYFDLVAEDGHGLNIYLYFSILNFPKIIHRILPFVYFLSLFYLLISYEKKNELSVLWINGTSKVEFINKIIIISFFLMIFQIINGAFFSPSSQFKARSLLKNSNIDFFTSLIKEGKFINVVSGLTIFINERNDDGSYTNIYLDDSTKKNPKIIYAKNGRLIDNGNQKILRLFNGKVINKENLRINTFEFKQIDFNLKDYSSKSITKTKIQEMHLSDLVNCIFNLNNEYLNKDFRCEPGILNEVKQEILKRLFMPIYLILIAINTCFLIATSKYKNNYSKIRNTIFISSILIIIFSETSLRYSLSSKLFFYVYLSMPILAIIFIYPLLTKSIKNV